MPPQQQNQYDFIMAPNSKPAGFSFMGNNKGARIAVVALLVIIIFVLGAVVNSFLNKGDQAQTQRLVEITQAQTEIIRVSSLAKTKATDINTRNYALNAQLSVESSQIQVKKVLAARGVKDKSLSKQLAASKNPKTDAALDEATKNSRFDETFITILNKQLTDYQKLLQAAYVGSTPTERTALNASFDNAGILIKQTASAPTQ